MFSGNSVLMHPRINFVYENFLRRLFLDFFQPSNIPSEFLRKVIQKSNQKLRQGLLSQIHQSVYSKVFPRLLQDFFEDFSEIPLKILPNSFRQTSQNSFGSLLGNRGNFLRKSSQECRGDLLVIFWKNSEKTFIRKFWMST